MLTETLAPPLRLLAKETAGGDQHSGGKSPAIATETLVGFDWTSVKRVLLVRLRSIWDTVLMTACLHALRTWRPDIEISVVIEPLSAPILEKHPLVDNLIVAGRSTGERARLIRSLRRSRYDLAVNMHGGATAAIVTALSGAGTTVGYEGLSQSWMLKTRAPAPDVILGRREIHSVEQQLALLHWLGMPFPQKPTTTLVVPEHSRAIVRARLSGFLAQYRGDRFALIAPCAAFESKQWPAASFAAVTRHINDRWRLPGVVIAGPGQEETAREVAAAAGPGAHSLTGISVTELMALSEMAGIFIGNDSGPMHIAAAFDRPIVVTFGPSNPSVWHPWSGAAYRVIRSAGIAQIKIGDVTGAVDELLDESHELHE